MTGNGAHMNLGMGQQAQSGGLLFLNAPAHAVASFDWSDLVGSLDVGAFGMTEDGDLRKLLQIHVPGVFLFFFSVTVLVGFFCFRQVHVTYFLISSNYLQVCYVLYLIYRPFMRFPYPNVLF